MSFGTSRAQEILQKEERGSGLCSRSGFINHLASHWFTNFFWFTLCFCFVWLLDWSVAQVLLGVFYLFLPIFSNKIKKRGSFFNWKCLERVAPASKWLRFFCFDWPCRSNNLLEFFTKEPKYGTAPWAQEFPGSKSLWQLSLAIGWGNIADILGEGNLILLQV